MADVTLAPTGETAHEHEIEPHHDYATEEPAGSHSSTGLSNNKLAMWLFLGSECLLFGGLISTYMLYRGRSQNGPRPETIYDIPFTSVSSFVLLMSSLTMVLAVSAAHRGDNRRDPAVAHHHGPARRHLRRRPGVRVHRLLPGGSRASPRTSSGRASTR